MAVLEAVLVLEAFLALGAEALAVLPLAVQSRQKSRPGILDTWNPDFADKAAAAI